MSDPNEGIPIRRGPFAGETTRKEHKIAEIRADLGVCLIGKHLRGTFRAVFSGCVVKAGSLFPNWRRKVCIVTSGKIDLQNVQYYLYFKVLDSRLKRIELEHVTSSKDKVEYMSGLAFIPLKDSKFSWNSTISSYRPFTVNIQEESLDGAVCHIVDGHTDGFSVKAFDVERDDEGYVLKLPEKNAIFKTFKELTAQGSNNLHPDGAVILKSVNNTLIAVGALDFVDDKISPVLFSQLREFDQEPSSRERVCPGVGRQTDASHGGGNFTCTC